MMTNNGGISNGSFHRNESDIEIKLKPSKLYISKNLMNCSNVGVKSDRFSFSNICISFSPGKKFNICLPYSDLVKIQYSISDNFSMLTLKPTSISYSKFMSWIEKGKNYGPCPVPENFIILESRFLTSKIIEQLQVFAKNFKNLRVVEINYVYAKRIVEFNNHLVGGNVKSPQAIVAPRSNPIERNCIELVDLEEDQENTAKSQENPLHKVILKSSDLQVQLIGRDLTCLRGGEYINDNIINFYIKHLVKQSKLTEEQLDRFYIYDALFATSLLEKPSSSKRRSKPFVEKYNSTLKRWTRGVDIFSKDFLIIPVVKDSHWFLAVLCYVGNVTANKTSPGYVHPLIIFMDSLNGEDYHSEGRIIDDVIAALIEYIRLELQEKHAIEVSHDELNLIFEIRNPKLPNQSNYYDCGLFVMEYFERFINSPDEIYKKISRNDNMLDWFDKNAIEQHKRVQILQIIMNLIPPMDAKELEEELKVHSLNYFSSMP